MNNDILKGEICKEVHLRGSLGRGFWKGLIVPGVGAAVHANSASRRHLSFQIHIKSHV